MRRNRMRRVLETLTDILLYKASAERATSRGIIKSTNRVETVENTIEYIRELHKLHGIEVNIGDRSIGLDN